MPTNCNQCNKPNASNRCGGCKEVFYCNSKCQRSNWKKHKKQCKIWTKQRQVLSEIKSRQELISFIDKLKQSHITLDAADPKTIEDETKVFNDHNKFMQKLFNAGTQIKSSKYFNENEKFLNLQLIADTVDDYDKIMCSEMDQIAEELFTNNDGSYLMKASLKTWRPSKLFIFNTVSKVHSGALDLNNETQVCYYMLSQSINAPEFTAVVQAIVTAEKQLNLKYGIFGHNNNQRAAEKEIQRIVEFIDTTVFTTKQAEKRPNGASLYVRFDGNYALRPTCLPDRDVYLLNGLYGQSILPKVVIELCIKFWRNAISENVYRGKLEFDHSSMECWSTDNYVMDCCDTLLAVIGGCGWKNRQSKTQNYFFDSNGDPQRFGAWRGFSNPGSIVYADSIHNRVWLSGDHRVKCSGVINANGYDTYCKSNSLSGEYILDVSGRPRGRLFTTKNKVFLYSNGTFDQWNLNELNRHVTDYQTSCCDDSDIPSEDENGISTELYSIFDAGYGDGEQEYEVSGGDPSHHSFEINTKRIPNTERFKNGSVVSISDNMNQFDGTVYITNNNCIYLYDMNKEDVSGMLLGHNAGNAQLPFRQYLVDSHNLLVSTDYRMVKTWDIRTLSPILSIKACGNNNLYAGIGFNANGNAFIASGGMDEAVTIWDIRNNKKNGALYEISTGNTMVQQIQWHKPSGSLFVMVECTYIDRMGNRYYGQDFDPDDDYEDEENQWPAKAKHQKNDFLKQFDAGTTRMKPCDPCYWLFSFSTKQIAAEQSKIATSLFQPPIATKEECPQISETIEVILESLINSSSFKQFEAECHRILLNALVDKCDDYLWISVVFFSMFMRCNFVGPFELTEHEMDEWDKWFKLELLSNDKQLTSVKCHQWLRIDNEDIEFELKYPFFLILSSIILENGLSSNKNGNNSNKNEISWHWWYVRVLRYHQNILSHRCPTLQNDILSHCQSIQELFPQSFIKLKETKQEINNNTIITLKELLKCQFNVEYALIANFYWKHEIVKKQILSAKQCLSDAFVYKLTSKLGKRTKYQIQSKSQLYLLVNSSIYKFFPSADLDIDEKTEEKESGLAAQQKHYKKTWYLPLNVRLEDDTLLDEIRWDDEIHHFKLHYLEYCIILFEAVQQSVINKVRGISELCILAYLDGLNSNGNIHDWSVQLFVLLQRSRTEFRNYSKQSRAIQQYESIQYHLDSMFDESRFFPPQYTALKTHIKLHSNDNRDNRLNVEYNELCTDIAYKRLRGIYGTILKSNAQIQCELGDLYMSLGFTRSALAIYEKLNHFQKVAQCLVNLDRKHDAKQLLFQQIKQIDLMHANKQKNDGKVRICQHYSWDKKPYYLCLLGDICEDNAYYQQAWNVSHKTYGRAMRTLAYNHYHSQEYEECIECARNALAINSLFPKVWFLLGSASMQLKQPIYEYVIESFSFVVSIDDTDFEAWNNLGAAHMNLNNYKSALYALQQAGNLRRGNWKIWENILTCSLKLKKLSKSISSLSHLIDIKKDTTSVNPNIIAALTVELTAKIEKYQLQNTDIDITDPEQKNEVQIDEKKADECGDELEEEELSKPTIISLMTQFDKLVLNILDRLSQHSFLSSSSHIKQSPFTKTGLLDNDNLLHGISENQRAKQTQSAYDIYEIFATYFEKCLRIEESVESRFKQCRIIMKYFEIISRQNAQINEKNKKEYLKIIHVLSRLTFLYSLQINGYRNSLKNEKGNLDINKLQQMLTSIQLLFNRLQKLSNKLYIDLKESKELTIKLQEMEQLSYKIKNESIKKEKESILSAFSDWM